MISTDIWLFSSRGDAFMVVGPNGALHICIYLYLIYGFNVEKRCKWHAFPCHVTERLSSEWFPSLSI